MNKYFDENGRIKPDAPVVLLSEEAFKKYFNGDDALLETAFPNVEDAKELENVKAFGGEAITWAEFCRRCRERDGRGCEDHMAYIPQKDVEILDWQFDYDWYFGFRIRDGRMSYRHCLPDRHAHHQW